MQSANIADIKNHFSRFIALVEQGEEIQVCKRNQAVAKIVSIKPSTSANKTRLGCGKCSVQIRCNLTDPVLPEEDWEMLKG